MLLELSDSKRKRVEGSFCSDRTFAIVVLRWVNSLSPTLIGLSVVWSLYTMCFNWPVK